MVMQNRKDNYEKRSPKTQDYEKRFFFFKLIFSNNRMKRTWEWK